MYWLYRTRSIKYYLGLAVSLAIIFVHIVGDMIPKMGNLDGIHLNNIPATTWIGTDFSGSFSMMFYLLLPLFSVLGLNLIAYEDKKSGVTKQYAQKDSLYSYSIKLFIISFFSGFMIVCLPLLLDLLVSWSLFPNFPVDNILNINLSVRSSSTYFSEYFFKDAYTVILFYIILASVLGGLFACVSSAISLFTTRIYSSVIVPFLINIFLIVFSYVFHTTFFSPTQISIVLSPVAFLPPLTTVLWSYVGAFFLSLWVIIIGVKKNVVL
ncbi:hypothetical protein IGI37_003722 [Enterococcus sp. AZ194]|uniref:hypothetical protein n=1 Tax=Enterococcus sp. AZ194 TaxID=2774629 RepID=UPI003F29E677